MEIEFGNAATLDTAGTGWLVGFGDWIGAGLRSVPPDTPLRGVQAKWMAHPAGDPRGTRKPVSVGRTLSVLVSEAGAFRLEFASAPDFPPGPTVAHTLRRHGDFAIWGEGVYHRWAVPEACVVLTLRWLPAGDAS